MSACAACLARRMAFIRSKPRLLGDTGVSLPDRGQNRLVHRCQQWLTDFATRTLREMTLDAV